MPILHQNALRSQQYVIPPQSSSSAEAPPSIRPSIAVPVIVQPDATSSRSGVTSLVQQASSSSEIAAPRIAQDISPLAKLSPFGRLRELARTEPVNFASTLVGIPGSAYLLLRSLVAIFPEIAVFFSWNAKAQAPVAAAASVAASGRDPLDWFVALIMGVTLIAALCATLFAQNAKKIDFGKDMTKLIMGFAVGFLGGKAR